MREQAVLEPCATCDKKDCGATVILSTVASGTKHFNQAKDCLDVVCPACNRPFSISIFKLQWMEVDEHEFTQGFLGGNDRSRFLHWMHFHPVVDFERIDRVVTFVEPKTPVIHSRSQPGSFSR